MSASSTAMNRPSIVSGTQAVPTPPVEPPPSGGGSLLPWAPPTTSTTIQLVAGNNTFVNQFSATQDIRFVAPLDGSQCSLHVQNNSSKPGKSLRNAVIIGGNFSMGSTPTDLQRAIFLAGVGGEVFVEGIRGTNPLAKEGDGIHINGGAQRVTIQNCWIDGIRGTNATIHGDALQTHGGIPNGVRVAHCSFASRLQGFIFRPDGGHIGNVQILESTIGQDNEQGSDSLYFITGTFTPSSWRTAEAIVFGPNFYSDPPGSTTLQNYIGHSAMLPTATNGGATVTFENVSTSTVAAPTVFDNRISGEISLPTEAPPGWTWQCGASVPGGSYVSPGYV